MFFCLFPLCFHVSHIIFFFHSSIQRIRVHAVLSEPRSMRDPAVPIKGPGRNGEDTTGAREQWNCEQLKEKKKKRTLENDIFFVRSPFSVLHFFQFPIICFLQTRSVPFSRRSPLAQLVLVGGIGPSERRRHCEKRRKNEEKREEIKEARR